MWSIAEKRQAVSFPEFLGERVYMREFRKRDGLPSDLKRWQKTVDAMLDGIDVDGPIYLMVDQGIVRSGNTHRRPGLHIDGYWNPGVFAHGGRPPGHGHVPTPDRPRHIHAMDWHPEALILASDVSACRAMVGQFEGVPADGGDCSHIDVSGMDEIRFQSGYAYAGNVTMLHESMPIPYDCARTLVRLNVPGWSPAP